MVLRRTWGSGGCGGCVLLSEAPGFVIEGCWGYGGWVFYVYALGCVMGGGGRCVFKAYGGCVFKSQT